MTFFFDGDDRAFRPDTMSPQSVSGAATALTGAKGCDPRRRSMMGGAVLGLGMTMLPLGVWAQSEGQTELTADPEEVRRIIAEFLNGAEPLEEGVSLDTPILADNPASVPVKVVLNEAMSPESYCEELIIIAEGNPRPLACRFHFTPLVGQVDVGVRLRLIGSQSVRAMARMSDGRVLVDSRQITVTAGGCGM